ncbi:protein of unknown function (plasmid) [Cupriavidus taiwanensis]|nr:protein of unknown function [Cupriavidus taiwanensis]
MGGRPLPTHESKNSGLKEDSWTLGSAQRFFLMVPTQSDKSMALRISKTLMVVAIALFASSRIGEVIARYMLLLLGKVVSIRRT